MYSAPLRRSCANHCRLVKRPRALSATICGKPSKRRASGGRKSRKKIQGNDQVKPNQATEDKEVQKGCIIVAEDVDGNVLFNFEPTLGSKQLVNGLTVLSTGQQNFTHLKLSQLAEGSGSSELTCRLWNSTVAPHNATTSTNDSRSDQSLLGLETETSPAAQASPQPSDDHTSTLHQQRPKNHTSYGSTSNTLSLLLGSSTSADKYEQSDIPEYSFAATQGSAPNSFSPAQQPALLRKPMRPSATEAPLPSTDSRFEKKEDRWVPCYLWHESGLPTKADLKDFPYEFITDNPESSEEPVTSSDVPVPIVDVSSQPSEHQADAAADTDVMQKAWGPIRQLFLRIWRLFPYWFRSMLLASQPQQPPAVHASRIIAQHTMAAVGTQVEGSTYDVESGRSPTPLEDLERYQIEDLVRMGVKKVELFRIALTAPSAITLDKTTAASFNRLEYLGDAAVSLSIRSWVFARFPDDDEGAMTNTCNTLVSNRAHVQYANHLNLTRYMAQNLKYQRPNARCDEDLLADAFEALVGAIYLDSGLQAASKFVIALANEVMGLENELSSYRNYKLYLVNSVNDRDLGRVTYQSKKRCANVWQSKCRLQGRLLGIGLDKQRKQAESAAAYAAMEELGFSDFVREPVGFRPSKHAAEKKPYFKPQSEKSPSQSASQSPTQAQSQTTVPVPKSQLSQKL